MRTHPLFQGSLLLFLSAILPACGAGKKLAPAPSVPTYGARGTTAMATVADVEMRAEFAPRIGGMNITRTVTPIRVTIRNRSERPLLVRYEDFTLDGEGGTRYAALPLFKREGTLDKPGLCPCVPPASHPELSYRHFLVAPHYATVYPGFPTAKWPFDLDPQYYANYFADSIGQTLPTEDMINEAIPEGIVESGGVVGGFFYFGKLKGDERALTFRAELVDARTGENFGTITIPFVVKEE